METSQQAQNFTGRQEFDLEESFWGPTFQEYAYYENKVKDATDQETNYLLREVVSQLEETIMARRDQLSLISDRMDEAADDTLIEVSNSDGKKYTYDQCESLYEIIEQLQEDQSQLLTQINRLIIVRAKK